jgi:membrane protease YdiL (CAAX protease family)
MRDSFVSDQVSSNSRLRIALTIFAIVLPTLVTWVYFSLLAKSDPAAQGAAYTIGKTIQFALPIFVLWRFGNWIKSDAPNFGASAILGVIIGIAICAAMYLVYRFVLTPNGVMDIPRAAVEEKLASTGLNTLSTFIAVSLGYALIHSLLEEYYWRWFVFGNLKTMVSDTTAIEISSVGFAAHHVIVLALYFGWHSPWTYIGAFCIAVGGAIWAWLYQRQHTLLGPWISHGMVDAMIFVIGYDLAF